MASSRTTRITDEYVEKENVAPVRNASTRLAASPRRPAQQRRQERLRRTVSAPIVHTNPSPSRRPLTALGGQGSLAGILALADALPPPPPLPTPTLMPAIGADIVTLTRDFEMMIVVDDTAPIQTTSVEGITSSLHGLAIVS